MDTDVDGLILAAGFSSNGAELSFLGNFEEMCTDF